MRFVLLYGIPLLLLPTAALAVEPSLDSSCTLGSNSGLPPSLILGSLQCTFQCHAGGPYQVTAAGIGVVGNGFCGGFGVGCVPNNLGLQTSCATTSPIVSGDPGMTRTGTCIAQPGILGTAGVLFQVICTG
jgi:hypothetical protein